MARTREELRRELSGLGPPEAVEVLMALARDCILLRRERCDDADIPIGASKIGGAPDVPPDFVWPQGVYDPMSFLAQIDLAEASPLDPTGLLPKTGLLSFFYEFHAVLHQGSMEDSRYQRVIFTHGDVSLERHALPEKLYHPSRVPEWWPPGSAETYQPESAAFHACRVRLDRLVMPPVGGSHTLAALPFPEGNEPDEVRNMATEWHSASFSWFGNLPPAHQMFGHQHWIQYDYEEPGEVLLLQIYSDEDAGIMWGDAGALYAYIAEKDLRRMDFSRVRMTWDCS